MFLSNNYYLNVLKYFQRLQYFQSILHQGHHHPQNESGLPQLRISGLEIQVQPQCQEFKVQPEIRKAAYISKKPQEKFMLL